MCISDSAVRRSCSLWSMVFAAMLITMTAQARENRPPSIGGSPAASMTIHDAYRFQPSVRDEDGDRLRFWIVNKPAWARFDTSTGRLSGTPNVVGHWHQIRIFVADHQFGVALPAFSIEVKARAPNSWPKILGVPPKYAEPGRPYSFVPHVHDLDGDTLTFVIHNKPAWAVFNTSTGGLHGMPPRGSTGRHDNVLIIVSDGRAASALSPFSITVAPLALQNPTAVALSWTMPTAAEDLAGYVIHYGTRPDTLVHAIHLQHPGLATYVVENLEPRTYYFAMRSISRAGGYSGLSNVISAIVR